MYIYTYAQKTTTTFCIYILHKYTHKKHLLYIA